MARSPTRSGARLASRDRGEVDLGSDGLADRDIQTSVIAAVIMHGGIITSCAG